MPSTFRIVIPETFAREVTKARRPVVVWFEALNAPSPKTFQSILADFAKQHRRRVKFAQVDGRGTLDELAKAFGVNRFPAVLFFRRGVMVQRAIGTARAEQLLQYLAEQFESKKRQK